MKLVEITSYASDPSPPPPPPSIPYWGHEGRAEMFAVNGILGTPRPLLDLGPEGQGNENSKKKQSKKKKKKKNKVRIKILRRDGAPDDAHPEFCEQKKADELKDDEGDESDPGTASFIASTSLIREGSDTTGLGPASLSVDVTASTASSNALRDSRSSTIPTLDVSPPTPSSPFKILSSSPSSEPVNPVVPVVDRPESPPTAAKSPRAPSSSPPTFPNPQQPQWISTVPNLREISSTRPLHSSSHSSPPPPSRLPKPSL